MTELAAAPINFPLTSPNLISHVIYSVHHPLLSLFTCLGRASSAFISFILSPWPLSAGPDTSIPACFHLFHLFPSTGRRTSSLQADFLLNCSPTVPGSRFPVPASVPDSRSHFYSPFSPGPPPVHRGHLLHKTTGPRFFNSPSCARVHSRRPHCQPKKVFWELHHQMQNKNNEHGVEQGRKKRLQ